MDKQTDDERAGGRSDERAVGRSVGWAARPTHRDVLDAQMS